MEGGPAAIFSRETFGAISSQFSTTSRGPKQSSHTCTGVAGYSSPHSRHFIPNTFAITYLLSQEKQKEPLATMHETCTGREALPFVVPPEFIALSQTRPQRVRPKRAKRVRNTLTL